MPNVRTERAILAIRAERNRQIEVEGWSEAHDDEHNSGGELAAAAACYLRQVAAYASMRLRGARISLGDYRETDPIQGWPWARAWWKPKDPKRDLIRVGAMVVAELERLERQEEITRDPEKTC
jgi:hypothetical protein